MMRKIITTLCLVGCFIFIGTYSVNSQSLNTATMEYRAELDRYMTLSGGNAVYKTMIDQMVDMLGAGATTEKKEEAKKIVYEKAVNKLIDDIAPVYQKLISLEDLKKMNEFYESDVAKRVVGTIPAIIKETAAISQQWVMGLQGMIQEALKS